VPAFCRADAANQLAFFEFVDLQFNRPFRSAKFLGYFGNGDICLCASRIESMA
jgi:hypothetical protein